MRTKPSYLINACPWCNYDHDPSNTCRFKPEGGRFDLGAYSPKKLTIKRIFDAKGNLIGVERTRQ